MALSLLESLRRLIRQDTVNVGGTVGNLHGAVRVDLGDLSEVGTQTWLALNISGTELPSLQQFLDLFAEQDTQMRLVTATDGVTSVTTKPNTVVLLRTVVTMPRGQSFPLQIALPGSGNGAAVYVNNSLVRTVQSTSSVTVSLSAGTHVLYVLASAPSLTITAPTRLTLVGETDMPRAPQWVSVTTGYMDENVGTASNVLRWASDPEVGNYRVYRREPVLLADLRIEGDGEVLEVTDLGTNNEYSITLAGDHSAKLTRNAVLLANGESVAVVAAVIVTAVGEDEDAVFFTEVTCRLPVGLSDAPTFLVGQLLYTGTFTEIARVTRVTSTGSVEYVDSSVMKDKAYEYALRATGLVDDTILSPMSAVQYIVSGDVVPPGPIIMADEYPRVRNRMVTVRFTTPEDLDYAGVNTYYRREIRNEAADDTFVDYNWQSFGTFGSPQVSVVFSDNNEFPTTDEGLEGYSLRFDIEEFSNYVFTVQSNTAASLILTELIPQEVRDAVIAAAQDGSVGLKIYKDTQITTDEGLPNREDQFTFEAADYGLYYFSSFDRSRNEQAFEDAHLWEYDASQDSFIGPPVLGLRQLLAREQAVFESPEDYSDRVQYALLELWAYDPGLPDSERFDGVTVYYQRDGQDLEPIPLTPIPHPDRPFPDYVEDETVVLTVSTSNGSLTATTASTADLRVGMVITGHPRIQAGTTVTSILNKTSFRLSLPAVSSGSGEATCTLVAEAKAVLDNPAGVRSRFVLLDRKYQAIRVWAENELGLSTDITTFIADVDTTPEAVVETYINPLNNTVRIVVVVDDDTEGFTWQIDNETPVIVDTRTIKRVELNGIPLTLGQQKRLTVIPYGTYIEGPPVSLEDPGPDVISELVRTPRSSVAFDSKDANGNRSSINVTATFSMAPAPQVLVGNRTCVVTAGSGDFILSDSGAPGWTPNQFQSGSTAYYYVLLKPSAGQNRPNIIRRIASNTGSTLRVTSGLENYVGIGSLSFDILDGAVVWRRVPLGGAGGSFAPTTGRETMVRGSESFEIEFFATKNACFPENVRRTLVDEDNLPSLVDFGYTVVEISDDVFWDVGFGAADDDATFWECYEKKNGWPTLNGQPLSTTVPAVMSNIDRTYLRFSGTVDQTSYRRSAAGTTANDVWYAIAVPKNSFGEVGYPSIATITAGGVQPPRLVEGSVTANVGTSTVNVNWVPNTVVSPGAVVSINAYRSDNPNITRSGTSTAGGSPFLMNISETIVASGGTPRTWVADIALAGGNTLSRTATFNVSTGGDGPPPPTPTDLTFEADGFVSEFGTCDANSCTSFFTRPHVRQITWRLTIPGQVVDYSSPYWVTVEGASTNVFTNTPNYRFLATNLPVADRVWEDISQCLYSDQFGEPRYWYYRVTLTDISSQIVGQPIIVPAFSDNVSICTEDGNTLEPF
jgi:hypothetical protein